MRVTKLVHVCGVTDRLDRHSRSWMALVPEVMPVIPGSSDELRVGRPLEARGQGLEAKGSRLEGRLMNTM